MKKSSEKQNQNSTNLKVSLSEYIIGRYIQKHALSMRALLVELKK